MASAGRARPNVPALPALEPQILKPLTPEEALAENAAIPFAKGPVEPSPPFATDRSLSDPLTFDAALDCLTAAVYYEAAGEGAVGQRAVAQVVLNRVRHPAFPATVCGVVYQGSERPTGCQFTFTCDGSLARRPNRAGWDRARKIAADALTGSVDPSIGMATHYHANWVVPYWARHLDKIAVVGTHIFYRWSGYWGRRRAFVQRYAGEALSEPPGLTSGTDPLAASGDGSAEFGAGTPPPGGLRDPGTRVLREDEHEGELIVDQAPGALVADERPARLARETDALP